MPSNPMIMLSSEDAQKILRKNVYNIIQKVNDGKPLSDWEKRLIEANTRKEDDSYEDRDWQSIKLEYIKGMPPMVLSKKHSIPIDFMYYRMRKERWVRDKTIFQTQMFQKAEQEFIQDLNHQIRIFLDHECQDVELFRDAVNSALMNCPEHDFESLQKIVNSRLKVHELGRKSLCMESDEDKSNTQNIPKASHEAFFQKLMAIKEIIEQKRFNPRTIDIDKISKEPIEKDL